MHKYGIGLDVGVASCSASIIKLDENNDPIDLENTKTKGLIRLWNEPSSPKTKEPYSALNGQRKNQIKLRARKKTRLKELRGILTNTLGLPSLDKKIVGNLVELRAKAVEIPLSSEELHAVLYKIAKKRGHKFTYEEFKEENNNNNTKDEKIKESKGMKYGEELLRQELNNKTVGQYLYERNKLGQTTKMKSSLFNEVPLYASRDMIEKELDLIFNFQKTYHLLLTNEVIQTIKDKIFFQKPPALIPNNLSSCSIAKNLPRVSKASVMYQKFLVEQQLSNIRVSSKYTSGQKLSPSFKKIWREALYKNAKISINDLKKLKDENGDNLENYFVNFDHARKKDLQGVHTLETIKNEWGLELYNEFLSLNQKRQEQVILILSMASRADVFAKNDWHLQYTSSIFTHKDGMNQKVKDFINKLIEKRGAKNLAQHGLINGKAKYSLQVVAKLLDCMVTNNIDEYNAIEILKNNNEPLLKNSQIKKRINIKECGSSVVQRALREINSLINSITKKQNSAPAYINIEVARELVLSREQRKELESRQNIFELDNNILYKEIKTIFNQYPTRDNIQKYKLWHEQDHVCPYCGLSISQSEIFSAKFEIDHIVPQSHGGKNNIENLVLVHTQHNQQKGKKTLYEAFNNQIEINALKKYEEKLAKYEKIRIPIININEKDGVKVKNFRKSINNAKRYFIIKKSLEKDTQYEYVQQKDFTQRQLQETAYIANLIRDSLEYQFNKNQQNVKISVYKGGITAKLRAKWKLNDILPELRGVELKAYQNQFGKYDKRIDNRHHFIDAVVIGLLNDNLARNCFSNEVIYPKILKLRDKITNILIKQDIVTFSNGGIYLSEVTKDTIYKIDDNGNKNIRKILDASLYEELLNKDKNGKDKTDLIKSAIIRNELIKIEQENGVYFKSLEKNLRHKMISDKLKALIHPINKNCIKRITLVYKNKPKMVQFENKHVLNENKNCIYYKESDGYAGVYILKDGTKTLITLDEYRKNKPKYKTKKGVSLFLKKGDTIKDQKNGTILNTKIASFEYEQYKNNIIFHLKLIIGGLTKNEEKVLIDSNSKKNWPPISKYTLTLSKNLLNEIISKI